MKQELASESSARIEQHRNSQRQAPPVLDNSQERVAAVSSELGQSLSSSDDGLLPVVSRVPSKRERFRSDSPELVNEQPISTFPSVFGQANTNNGPLNIPYSSNSSGRVSVDKDKETFQVCINPTGSRLVKPKTNKPSQRLPQQQSLGSAANQNTSSSSDLSRKRTAPEEPAPQYYGKQKKTASNSNLFWLKYEVPMPETTLYGVRDKFQNVKELSPEKQVFDRGDTLYLGFESNEEADKALRRVMGFEQDTKITKVDGTPPRYDFSVPPPSFPNPPPGHPPPASPCSVPPLNNQHAILVLAGFNPTTKVSHIRRLLKENGWDHVRNEDIKTSGLG